MAYVTIGANSMDPDQNAPTLCINSQIWVHTVCKKDTVYFSKHHKKTTFAVIGALKRLSLQL